MISEPLPTVVAKEGMVMQIFQNLLGNCLKYRSEAAPMIDVSAERTAEGWLFGER